MKSTTQSHVRPAKAAAVASVFEMSAVIVFAPGIAVRVERLRSVTSKPRAIASSVQAVLMYPVPPIKSTFIGVTLYIGAAGVRVQTGNRP